MDKLWIPVVAGCVAAGAIGLGTALQFKPWYARDMKTATALLEQVTNHIEQSHFLEEDFHALESARTLYDGIARYDIHRVLWPDKNLVTLAQSNFVHAGKLLDKHYSSYQK